MTIVLPVTTGFSATNSPFPTTVNAPICSERPTFVGHLHWQFPDARKWMLLRPFGAVRISNTTAIGPHSGSLNVDSNSELPRGLNLSQIAFANSPAPFSAGY